MLFSTETPSNFSHCSYASNYHSTSGKLSTEEFSESEFLSTDEEEEEEEEEFSCEEVEENISHKLLSFANKITKDLNYHFNYNLNGEDHCDIYENKFGKTPSGRDLYYADLLAMACYGDNAESTGVRKAVSKWKHRHKSFHCGWPCSGKRNPDMGLGPLSELFDHLYKDQNVLKPNKQIHHSELLTSQDYGRNHETSGEINQLNTELTSVDNVDLTDIFDKWLLENDTVSPHFLNFITGH